MDIKNELKKLIDVAPEIKSKAKSTSGLLLPKRLSNVPEFEEWLLNVRKVVNETDNLILKSRIEKKCNEFGYIHDIRCFDILLKLLQDLHNKIE